jgi:hypothetical protein
MSGLTGELDIPVGEIAALLNEARAVAASALARGSWGGRAEQRPVHYRVMRVAWRSARLAGTSASGANRER